MKEQIVYNKNDLKIETPEGYKSFDGIIKIYNQPCLRFVTENNSLTVSINHRFIIDNEIVLANDLIEGEVLQTHEGFEKIISIEFVGYHDVYDMLEVKSSDHSYIANAIKNSNCKFLGSSSTLIDADVLERIKIQQPVATKFGDLMVIFEQPKIGKHHYILGIDSAGGTGADYSIIQVLKVNAYNDIKQVATYANNMISPHEFAEVCIAVSDYYLNAQMMVENNEMGGQVADKIWYDFECDRILNTDVKGIGTRSTRKSKLIANMLLKRYLEEGWLHVVNKESIRQMAMYEEVTPNVFKGPRTDHDDHVAGLLWALYYLQTPFFEGDTTSVRRSIKEVYKIIPDDETDKAMMLRNPAYQDKAERMGETDEGEIPPVMDDDPTEFEWPEDLDE